MNIALIGFGSVGQGFASVLQDCQEELRMSYGLEARLVAVVTRSRGSLVDPAGLNLGTLLSTMERDGRLENYPDAPTLSRDWDALRVVQESNADVIVEATPSNLQSGQPALDLCRAAIAAGRHVVMANKGPAAVDYAGLMASAREQGLLLRLEATVMAGTPAIRVGAHDLACSGITAAKGIVNGTTNYMLGLMEEGMSYGDALAQAQALGYAEPDPSGDVEGWDSAGKAIILSAVVFGRKISFADMQVKGITDMTPEKVQEALNEGYRYKLIAEVTREAALVSLMKLPLSHPLASVSGTTNAITYSTRFVGEVTLIGAGAGPKVTGYGLLSDLIDIHTRS